MKIAFVASEASPFIKTGGLGDVAGALPETLSDYKGNEISVFLPYYKSIKEDVTVKTELVGEFEVRLSWRRAFVGLYRYKSKRRKLQVYFIDSERYFDRERLYGYYDDGERFAYFCKAVLESLCFIGQRPDVIHCNDWQTALIPVLMHAFYNSELSGAKTVFTIHNTEYQGWADPHFISDVLGLPERYENTFAFNGSVNFMKGAILSCDALTTVSRSYAQEICYPEFAHGLSDIIKDHDFKTVGIVNGIDISANDPSKDIYLAKNYDVSSFEEGKSKCKKEVREAYGLSDETGKALVGLVSRLVSHKGLDILCDALDEIMCKDIQLVILGTGDEYFEKKLADAAERYPEKLAVILEFSSSAASRIYAASDIYLMPSKSEPCGLSQMLAMHYGAVPVVHETGGLKDTVIPYNEYTGEGTGFSFGNFNKDDMLLALDRAIGVYSENKERWRDIIKNCMSADFSWRKPAEEYMSLYKKLISAPQ